MADNDMKEAGKYLFVKLKNAEVKRSELETDLKSVTEEIASIKALIENLGFCKECRARGEYRQYNLKNPDGIMDACPKCKGEGRTIPESKSSINFAYVP